MPKSVDLDEFEAAIKKGPTCSIAAVDLTEEQAEKLAAALARKDITSAQIARVLKSWGKPVVAPVVARHRRKDCTCE